MFTVYIDDVFNLYDTDCRRKHGEYQTYEEAVGACKKLIDDFIEDHAKNGEDELHRCHYFWGKDPWVSPEPPGKHFSSSQYFQDEATRIFGKGKQP